jgi:hypothetical protein
MSSYMVVAGVSEALRRVLWEELSTDPEVGQLFPSEQDIVFSNPTQTAQNTSNRLSLWLYQITENEFVKNQPVARSNGPETQGFAPLAINLNFLITPFTHPANGDPSARDEDHMVLGKIMQVLHDNAIVYVRDVTNDIAEELRIIFKRHTLEELTRIWEALREPYRLSVCYEIRVSRIDSRRISSNARVVDRSADHGALPSQATG